MLTFDSRNASITACHAGPFTGSSEEAAARSRRDERMEPVSVAALRTLYCNSAFAIASTAADPCEGLEQQRRVYAGRLPHAVRKRGEKRNVTVKWVSRRTSSIPALRLSQYSLSHHATCSFASPRDPSCCARGKSPRTGRWYGRPSRKRDSFSVFCRPLPLRTCSMHALRVCDRAYMHIRGVVATT